MNKFKSQIFIIGLMILAMFIVVGCNNDLKFDETKLSERLIKDGIPTSKGQIIPETVSVKIKDREDLKSEDGSKYTNLEIDIVASNKYLDTSGTYKLVLKKHDTDGFKITSCNLADLKSEKISVKNIPNIDLGILKNEMNKEIGFREIRSVKFDQIVDYNNFKINSRNNITVEVRVECMGNLYSESEKIILNGIFKFELVDDEWKVSEYIGQ